MGDNVEIRRIVRIYSFEAEDRLQAPSEAQNLGHILSEGEPSLEDIVAPWRRFFEPWEPPGTERDPITEALSIEATKLQKQWLEFQKRSPREEQIDISTVEPTIADLIKMVATVSNEWEEKRGKGKGGKAKSYFHRFCRTLDAHSNMLEVVPKGDKYVSLFTGTITSIIKASVNHETIAEELAHALWVISEHVAACETDLEMFKTESMQRKVADLYAHIFLFLTDTLSWYTRSRRKRLTDSFNERFMHEFEAEIENIKHKSDVIRREAEQNRSAELRATRMILERTRTDVRVGLEGLRREQAETRHFAQHYNDQLERERARWEEKEKCWMNLTGRLFQQLTDAAQAYQVQSPSPIQVRQLIEIEAASITNMESASSTCHKRDDLVLNSVSLEDFFDRDRVRGAYNTDVPLMVPTETMTSLTEWTRLSDSRILSISGPEYIGDELEDPMSMLAAKFIGLAVGSKVPLVSYFCKLQRSAPKGGHTREIQGLIQLVYAMIRQMVELVLSEFDCSKDFSKTRFSRLDGGGDSLEEAITVLGDLIEILPGKVFCIINGTQWLDDRSTAIYLFRLVETLRNEKLKVLFTTSGNSRALLHSLSRSELLILDMPLRSGRHMSWEFDEAVFQL